MNPMHDSENIHDLGNLSPEDRERFNRDYETSFAWVKTLSPKIEQTRDAFEQAARAVLHDNIETHLYLVEDTTWRKAVTRYRYYSVNVWSDKTGYLFHWFAPALVTEEMRLSDDSVRELNVGLRVIFIG